MANGQLYESWLHYLFAIITNILIVDIIIIDIINVDIILKIIIVDITMHSYSCHSSVDRCSIRTRLASSPS